MEGKRETHPGDVLERDEHLNGDLRCDIVQGEMRSNSVFFGRYAWLVILLAAVCGCDRGQVASERPSAAPPNIVLYIVDTLRADSLRCYGNPVVETPAFDRLAREGTLFENAFAQNSWTRPSIASILTSLYPSVHGARGRNDALADEIVLLSERLQSHGYRTCCITTNPNIGSCFGFNQGFDDFIELYARRRPGFVRQRELTTTADEVTRRAVQWIKQAKEPFFLMILTIDPHSPYTPPVKFDRYGGDYAGHADGTKRWIYRKDLTPADKERIRSLYYGEIAFNDDAFGRLLDYLRNVKLDERTIITFTSDHGEEFWEHGLRGHGKTLYDESLHVPLIVRYPRSDVPAGARITRTVQLLDVFPTILQLAGLPIPEDLDGRSLFAPADENEGAALSSLKKDKQNLVALRDFPWKMIWDLESGEKLLFNLAESPGELDSSMGLSTEDGERLIDRLTTWMDHTAERSMTLHGGAAPSRVSPAELTEEERTTLQELGYIDNGNGNDDVND